jgi:hypothetical protein
MPPKRGKKAPKVDGGAAASMQKEYLSLQIKNQQSKLEQTRARADQLDADYTQLSAEHSNQAKANRDIIDFLKGQLQEKEEQLGAEVEVSTALRDEKDKTELKHSDELEATHKEALHIKRELESEINKLREELDDLNEFRIRKADHEAELEAIKLGKEQERERHKERVYQLEREVVVEKERLKQDTENRIEQTRAELMDAARSRLGNATQRTIVENDQLTRELAQQAKRASDLLTENNELTERNRDLFRNLEMVAQMEEELTRKNQTLQHTLSSLKAENKDLRREIAELDRRRAREVSVLTARLDAESVEGERLKAQVAENGAAWEAAQAESARNRIDTSAQIRTLTELSQFVDALDPAHDHGPDKTPENVTEWLNLVNSQVRHVLLYGVDHSETGSAAGPKIVVSSDIPERAHSVLGVPGQGQGASKPAESPRAKRKFVRSSSYVAMTYLDFDAPVPDQDGNTPSSGPELHVTKPDAVTPSSSSEDVSISIPMISSPKASPRIPHASVGGSSPSSAEVEAAPRVKVVSVGVQTMPTASWAQLQRQPRSAPPAARGRQRRASSATDHSGFLPKV